MSYIVTWSFAGGTTERQTFDTEVVALQEANKRAVSYATVYGRCDVTVNDESGQPVLIHTEIRDA